MKRKDIALIAFIVVISTVIAFVISNSLFSSPKKRQQQTEVVQPITTDFPQPDSHYINNQAFDPTKLITIGQNNNTDPFSGNSQ